MKMKIRWALGAVLLATAAAAFYFSTASTSAAARAEQRSASARPVPVAAARVERGEIEVLVNALGTVTALNTVTVKPRVDGLLQRIAFSEGQLVKAGDLIAELDARPYQALFDQANGQLQRDQALLANAQLDVERYRDLLASDSIARQVVDAQEALVRQYQGTVLADRGAVDTARLQLGFTRISAPLSGRLGLRQVDVGNMVHASDTTGIVIITQTQPISVVFAIPADHLGAVLKQLRAGQALRVDAWDRENRVKLASGKLLSLDNQIDTTTGTVKIKAVFANDDNALYPNQFVNARLRVETRNNATIIPQAAVQRGTQGSFVYVVDGDTSTVSTRSIVLGPAAADRAAVEKGLEVGEQVVTDGADKLRQGSKVELPGTGPRNTAEEAAPAATKAQR
jgi:membrane fusion protein, multidrug efflux system